MQYNECLNLIFSTNRRQTATSVKDRPCEEQSPEFVETLQEGKYRRTLKKVNALKHKYMPESKPIIPPLVMKMEPLVPIGLLPEHFLDSKGFQEVQVRRKTVCKDHTTTSPSGLLRRF
uniref:Serine--tRNA ligase n=1 Tax=Lygus hesperus TaxID=30085 RepID=A0A0A9YE45_LYGHE